MSDRSDPSAHRVAALLADAGWADLLNRILMGLCHDVNGRVASLEAARQLAEMGASGPDNLGYEVERLTGVAARMEALVGDVEGPAAAFPLSALLATAVELHAHLKDVGGAPLAVAEEPDLPPVLVNEARGVRLLLLFVDLASRAGVESLELGGDADGAELSFAAPEADAERERAAALDRVAACDGGRVSWKADRCSLELPSLARARAEGR